MPHIHVAWLPKACRTPAVRKEVADAILKVRDERSDSMQELCVSADGDGCLRVSPSHHMCVHASVRCARRP